ncbi:MAG: hypothetical protein V4671_09645 [Armatimonadota bacterium]
MQQNKPSVKQWLVHAWLGWWHRITTDPNPERTESLRRSVWLFTLGALGFSYVAMAYQGERRALVFAIIATIYGGLAALSYAVLQERRRIAP